jgi:hypothetical protein
MREFHCLGVWIRQYSRCTAAGGRAGARTVRTKSGQAFGGDALQQCVCGCGERREALNYRDFPIAIRMA